MFVPLTPKMQLLPFLSMHKLGLTSYARARLAATPLQQRDAVLDDINMGRAPGAFCMHCGMSAEDIARFHAMSPLGSQCIRPTLEPAVTLATGPIVYQDPSV